MKLDDAQKVAEMITRPVKMTDKIGNKILGRFVEVRTIPRDNDAFGDSRVVVLDYEDSNMKLEPDQHGGDGKVQVYMSGQLDYLVSQLAGKTQPGENPLIIITYTGVSKGVETEYGKKDVHRFTVETVPEAKASKK